MIAFFFRTHPDFLSVATHWDVLSFAVSQGIIE
jgi:hypothetical protein